MEEEDTIQTDASDKGHGAVVLDSQLLLPPGLSSQKKRERMSGKRFCLSKIQEIPNTQREHSSNINIQATISALWLAENMSVNPKSAISANSPKTCSQVAADQFKPYDCMALLDFYSDIIEVNKLEENTSSSVIEFLKEQFGYGIPVFKFFFSFQVMNFIHFHLTGTLSMCHPLYIITKIPKKWSHPWKLPSLKSRKTFKNSKNPLLALLTKNHTNWVNWYNPKADVDVSSHRPW